jgi:transcriptional regulator with XRE-family HTH domain
MVSETSQVHRPRPGEIRSLRIAKGLGQPELAKASIVSVKTLSGIENGNAAYLKTFAKIAKALGVECAQLIEGATIPKQSTESGASRRLVRIGIKIDIPFDDFDETHPLAGLMAQLTTTIAAAGPVAVFNIEPGCVKLTLEMPEGDAGQLVRAFGLGNLDGLQVDAVILSQDKKALLSVFAVTVAPTAVTSFLARFLTVGAAISIVGMSRIRYSVERNPDGSITLAKRRGV